MGACSGIYQDYISAQAAFYIRRRLPVTRRITAKALLSSSFFLHVLIMIRPRRTNPISAQGFVLLYSGQQRKRPILIAEKISKVSQYLTPLVYTSPLHQARPFKNE